MLSNIVWTNENVSDNFHLFGGNEAAARSIVQRALQDWAEIIEDFNYADGTNTFSIEIVASFEAPPGIANITQVEASGKPTHATLQLNPGSDWYFDGAVGDPGVPDDSEFDDFITPFAAGMGTGPLDFYMAVLHELGHGMGVSTNHPDLAIHDFFVEASVVDDPNNPSQLILMPIGNVTEDCTEVIPAPGMPGLVYCFDLGNYLYGYDVDGGGVDYTLTDAGSSPNGGHLYEGADNPEDEAIGITTHPRDLMNDGRAWFENGQVLTERRLISDTDAQFLEDVYGYTVKMPSQVNTFYANLNVTTGVLVVRGDAGDHADTIYVDDIGGQLRVRVNGAEERFNYSDVSSIAISGGDGDDVIRIDELPAGMPTTIGGGAGDDEIWLAQPSGHLEDIQSDVHIHGGQNNDFDVVYLQDQNHIGNETYSITNSEISRTGMSATISYTPYVERLIIAGEQGDSTFNMESGAQYARIDMFGGAGDDTFNIGLGQTMDVRGTQAVIGGEGNDTIVFDDSNEVWFDTYEVTAVSISAHDGTLVFDQVELIDVLAGQGNDLIYVNGAAPAAETRVFAGQGSDTIHVNQVSFDSEVIIFGQDDDDTIVVGNGDLDSNIHGELTLDGGGQADHLLFDDTSDDGGDDGFGITAFTVSNTNAGVWVYSNFEDVTIQASFYDNSFYVTSLLNIELFLFGNGGDDDFFVGGGILDSVDGDLTVHGGSGDNSVVVNNSSDVLGRTYYFFDHYLDVDGDFGLLDYAAIDTLTVDAGAADDLIVMTGTAVITDVVVNSGAGDDLFRIGEGDLNAIGGSVYLTGHAGHDTVEISDDASVGNVDYSIDSSSVHRPGFQLSYANMELLRLAANDFPNTIHIESVALGTPVTVNGGGGGDVVHVAPLSQLLAAIEDVLLIDGSDGADTLMIHDQANAVGNAVVMTNGGLAAAGFALQYLSFDRLVLQLGSGDDLVDLQSSAPGMRIVVQTGAGKDVIAASLPQDALLTLDGQAGFDIVHMTGSNGDERISMSAGYGSADVNLAAIEGGSIDMAGGQDVLALEGIIGVDEWVEVEASAMVGEGELRVVGALELAFHNTEWLDLLGNPSDNDIVDFFATATEDLLEINLAADGTTIDPLLQLIDPNSLDMLLGLLDYRDFNLLQVMAGAGADEINVHVDAAGSASYRHLFIDGGAPGNGPGGKDKLNVLYAQPKPSIDKKKTNPGAGAGYVELNYALHEFLIEYEGIERLKVTPD